MILLVFEVVKILENNFGFSRLVFIVMMRILVIWGGFDVVMIFDKFIVLIGVVILLIFGFDQFMLDCFYMICWEVFQN